MPEPKLDAVATTPTPAPDVTPEPKLDAVATTPAPAPDVTPEPKLDAVATTPISVPQSATRAPNDPAVQLDSDEMTRLIKRGKDFLAQGNFASARLLFKRAANVGSAEAALALGSTYDPSVIKQLGAVSITPDIDAALKWYETAAAHGSAEAAGLLANLMRLRKAAMAAKPTAAKPRSETEPVEEKANSRTITEPEVPPSTQPLATPGPVPKKETTAIGGKEESQATRRRPFHHGIRR
jgi:TPR repeat protein